jgi:hypothetical protein
MLVKWSCSTRSTLLPIQEADSYDTYLNNTGVACAHPGLLAAVQQQQQQQLLGADGEDDDDDDGGAGVGDDDEDGEVRGFVRFAWKCLSAASRYAVDDPGVWVMSVGVWVL